MSTAKGKVFKGIEGENYKIELNKKRGRSSGEPTSSLLPFLQTCKLKEYKPNLHTLRDGVR
jgi:hypothetical protein